MQKYKNIWFVSHYTMPPEYEMRFKTLYHAKILKEMGYDVTIFNSSFLHNTNTNLITDKKPYVFQGYGEFDFVHIRTSSYTGNGIKRILNMRMFSQRFCKIANKLVRTKKTELPDVIVSDLTCVDYKWVYKFASKHKIRLVLDVRDLWPESIVEYLGFSKNNPIIKYLYREEKRMFRLADKIIFSMEGGVDYLREKEIDKIIDMSKVYHINNGVDVEENIHNIEQYPYFDEDLNNQIFFKLVYVGSIRDANGVQSIAECAKILKEIDSDIKFIIFGEGDKKSEIEAFCKKNDLDNIVFKGFVNKKYIPSILSKADANIITVRQTNITLKYGCSFNKLFDYMAAGKPIISNITVAHDLILKHNCGVVTEDQTPEAMTKAILSIKSMSFDNYKNICENALMVAKEYDYKILTERLKNIIFCDEAKEDVLR